LLTWYGVRKRQTPRAPERRKTERRKLIINSQADMAAKRKADRRKQRAEESWIVGGTQQGWLSAHVYLGVLLLLLSSLHAGFRFQWNIHTLAYALVWLVVVSGFYGAYAYSRYPRLIADNIGNDQLPSLLLRIAELDEIALSLPDEINSLVTRARQQTPLGGHLLQQLRSTEAGCPTDYAVQRLQDLGKALVDGDQPRLVRDLYVALLQKQRLLVRVRKHIRLTARMQFWLILHVPLTIALLATLSAHVLLIFVYW
jgi:hypothetical protein